MGGRPTGRHHLSVRASSGYHLGVGILLWLLGLVAIGSGALKLTPRVRALVGRAPLALAEVVVGVLVALGSGLSLGRVRPLAWTVVVLTGALVVVSSVRHARRVAERYRRRRQSEDERLRRHLQA
ncbi:MAG: hypothetical protein PVF27_03680 [Gemmatimonadales bacterium]|jgi:Kef-type K+ transport system membrane component KefB